MSLLFPGLVTVTFRQLAVPDVVALAAKAKVRGIEWGGDIHVPPGDLLAAREAGARTRDAGLEVVAYGSYYRVGGAEGQADFGRHLESAAALEAPVIRVWAGSCGSDKADEQARARVIEDTRRICTLAGAAGIVVAYEHHGGTLADSAQAAALLLQQADSPNLKTLWQPQDGSSADSSLADLQSLLPWIAHVHAFHWPDGTRAPLSTGEALWKPRLTALSAANRPLGVLLEFVRDDSPDQFLADAAALRDWLSELP